MGKFSQAMENSQVPLTFLNRCTVKSENVSGDSVIHHRKRKKQRSVPAHSYPVALTQNTYSQVQVFLQDGIIFYWFILIFAFTAIILWRLVI